MLDLRRWLRARRAGLLAGRPATTHWALHDAFAARFPEVLLDTDQLVIDDGDLITAGGFMAWVDLGLRLVDRWLGPTTMLATARYYLVDPGGREQRFYKAFAPPLTHGDAPVLKAQHWLQARSADRLTLPMMARKAGLGERTFQRRFHRATGQKPLEYLQHLRVRKARELLGRCFARDTIASQAHGRASADDTSTTTDSQASGLVVGPWLGGLTRRHRRPQLRGNHFQGATMTTTAFEVGKKLVELCKQGKNDEAMKTLYAKDIVSVEAAAPPGQSAEVRGIEAVIAKSTWWAENHQIHSAICEGPYPNGDRFIVRFNYDVTNKPSNKRIQMDETALFTVKDGKIVREEFFYAMGG